jgi:hypothetical protein
MFDFTSPPFTPPLTPAYTHKLRQNDIQAEGSPPDFFCPLIANPLTFLVSSLTVNPPIFFLYFCQSANR